MSAGASSSVSSALLSPLVVGVLGGGRWARALAATMAQNHGSKVARILFYRPPHLPDLSTKTLPNQVELVRDLSPLRQADLILLAVPAGAARQLLREAGAMMHGGQVLVHAIGSLEPDAQGLTPISQVALQETPIRKVGALAGPALAQDLEEGRPAALICGSRFDEVGTMLVDTLSTKTLRIYTTRDLRGVELSRAMVSVIALAGGVGHSLGVGPGARAVLVTRGAAEMARLGVALGAHERTFFGLAGVGELVVATEGRGSADFELGAMLGKGISRKDAEAKIGRTVDGPTMVKEVLRLSTQHGVRMPLSTALSRWLSGERTIAQALLDLYTGPEHVE